MKKLLFFISISLIFAGKNPVIASTDDNRLIELVAGSCAQKANQLAAGYARAQVISVDKNSSGKCIIVIRVPGKNGKQPRILRKTVSG